MFEINSFLKNAAKLHFYFHLTKYLSRNSRKYLIFFHFVKSAYHFTVSFDSLHLIHLRFVCAKIQRILHIICIFITIL